MGSISSDSMNGGPYSSIPSEEEEEEETCLIRKEDGDDDYADLEREETEEFECDAEFEPIEHPMEPLEEDQPTKCPNPVLDSSILRVREMTMMLSYFG